MKHVSITSCLGLLMLFFSSCKKEAATESITNSTSLIGTWELRQGQGSMLPVTVYPSGNGTLIKFSDSSYESYTAGNLVKQGTYIVVKDTSAAVETGLVIPVGQFTDRIIFDTAFSAPKTFFAIENNRLTLLSGYFPLDGGAKVMYERLTTSYE